jgi:TonB family protein
MTTTEKTFRKNFVFTSVMHVGLIAGVVFWEGFISHERTNSPTAVDLVTPADILGDLPKGAGRGRGEYTPPSEPSTPQATFPSGASNLASDEQTAPPPTPKPSQTPANDPKDIVVPKKITPKSPQKATPVPARSAQTNQTAPTTQTAQKAKASPAKSATGPVASADDFRKRFEKALRTGSSGAGGTPYGDNKPAGGGSGRSARIGSPDGSADGIPGGVGKGSLFSSYYIHVHDKMYEAWEQPGDALHWDKKVMTTIVIRVARDGRIENVSLKVPSGNKLMDDSALAAARRVSQLDRPPDGLVKGLFAEISIDFQLEDK